MECNLIRIKHFSFREANKWNNTWDKVNNQLLSIETYPKNLKTCFEAMIELKPVEIQIIMPDYNETFVKKLYVKSVSSDKCVFFEIEDYVNTTTEKQLNTKETYDDLLDNKSSFIFEDDIEVSYELIETDKKNKNFLYKNEVGDVLQSNPWLTFEQIEKLPIYSQDIKNPHVGEKYKCNENLYFEVTGFLQNEKILKVLSYDLTDLSIYDREYRYNPNQANQLENPIKEHEKQIQVKQFSEDQENVLNFLNSNNGNVFISGAAGTGKSFVLNWYRKNAKNKNLKVVSSTGISALIIEGTTFHYFFGILAPSNEQEFDANTYYHNQVDILTKEQISQINSNEKINFNRSKWAVIRIRSTDVIIWDEISMTHGWILTKIEELCRKVRRINRPWGGIRMIFSGDFCQLPPVGEPFDWAFKSNGWKQSNITPFYLKTNHRQGQDSDFFYFLNKVRSGQLDENARRFVLNIINRKINPEEEKTFLFHTNRDVFNFNVNKLNGIDSELYTSKTFYKVLGRYLSNYNEIAVHKDKFPIDEKILLKIGVSLIIRKNDTLNWTYANGTICTLKNINFNDKDYPEELIVDIKGKNVILHKENFEITKGEGQVIYSAYNFPVNLAYALTIHKSQGLTLDSVHVNMPNHKLHGLPYVALSRVKCSNDLSLAGFIEENLIVDESVREFYKL